MKERNGAAGPGRSILLLAGFLALVGPLVGSMGGCITINIYFPAAAAEKAADRIIDDVLDTKGGAAAPAAPTVPAAPVK